MDLFIFGLGYVGSVSLGCFARMGHQILGVDIQEHKVQAIGAGECAVSEPLLPEIIVREVGSGKIHTTMDSENGEDVCRQYGLDSHAVMDIFCLDDKLSISPSDLKPGFAFGGLRLPKDVSTFVLLAKESRLPLPVIESILASNDFQIERAVKKV